MKSIKIDNINFQVENFSTQLSTGSHATIVVTINIATYPSYYKFFVDYFDKCSNTTLSKKDYSFNIQHLNYMAYGCIIKSLDIDNMNYIMQLHIVCDYFEQMPISERREQIINDILDNNFDKE